MNHVPRIGPPSITAKGRMATHPMRATLARWWTMAIVMLVARVSLQGVEAAEVTVVAEKGNIVFRTSQGETKQLTQSGHDSAPVLSPDGRWIVFVRALPGKEISTGGGAVPAEELWQIRVNGKEATRLVAPRDAKNMREVIASFEDVQFSTDGRHVYFMTPAYVTSGAVHVVDTTNGKERFLMAGHGVEVVQSGEYRNCLLIGQHRYFLGGGSFDWIWLLRPDGKEIGPVGEDATNFKELYVPGTEKR